MSGSIENVIKKQRMVSLKLSDSTKEKKIRQTLSCLEISGENILSFANLFNEMLVKGLQYNQTSPFNMQNTFVFNVLEGDECGPYLALDVGGTNFRVLFVELLNGQIVREEVEKYEVPDNLRIGSGTDLFEFFAKCLEKFVSKYGLATRKIPLGFTFSFPTDQYALDSSTLQTWIGLYDASGVVGQDVVKLLNDAIAKTIKVDIPVVAVLNDTVGVLIRGSLIDKATGISLILGTGSNVCYFEKTESIPDWNSEKKEVALNIEWGPFTDNGRADFVKTKYDKAVDEASLHPDVFTFEKLVGGEFLGKLVRLILLDLANEGLIFDGRVSEALKNDDIFSSAHISEIEKDNLENISENTKRILANDLGIDWFSNDDVITLKYICELVSIRLAILGSAALSEVIKRMNRSSVTIACDGSLYKYHPRLHSYFHNFTSSLSNYKSEIKFILAEDGSGIGGALVAALACKANKKK